MQDSTVYVCDFLTVLNLDIMVHFNCLCDHRIGFADNHTTAIWFEKIISGGLFGDIGLGTLQNWYGLTIVFIYRDDGDFVVGCCSGFSRLDSW
jgi:hypothetical protein